MKKYIKFEDINIGDVFLVLINNNPSFISTKIDSGEKLLYYNSGFIFLKSTDELTHTYMDNDSLYNLFKNKKYITFFKIGEEKEFNYNNMEINKFFMFNFLKKLKKSILFSFTLNIR